MTTGADPRTDAADEDGDAEAEDPGRSGVRAGVSDRVVGVKAAVEARREELEQRRHHVPLLDVLWRTFELDLRVNGGVLAAAVAFRLFLLLVPLALVLITGLGMLADSAQQSPQDLARQAGITGLIASAVGNAGELTTFNRLVLLAGGLYASVRGGRSLLRVLDTAHALVWEEDHLPKRTSRSVLGLLGIGVLIIGVVLAMGRLRQATPGPGLLVTVLIGVVFVVLWCWIGGLLPHGDAPRWALLPGALLFGVGVHLVHLFTVYYLSHQVEGRSTTYGALGVSMAVLLWSYVVGRLVLLAAELDATAWRRHRPHATSTEAEPLAMWPTLLRAELWRPSPSEGEGGAARLRHDDPPDHREDTEVATLTVWKFADPQGANQAETTLASLAKQQLITVEDAATVSWEPGKKKPKTRQLHNLAGLGALDGAFWGMLFGLIFFVPLLGAAVGAAAGALGGSMADVGIDDDLIKDVRARITPGTSALFLLSSDAVIDRVKEAFDGVDMELISTNLSHDAEAKLRDTFTH